MVFYYFEPENIVKELGEKEALRLTDNGNGIIDIERIRNAEKDAETTVNAYLKGRYSLPFDNDNVPAIIKIIAKELAIINLYEASYSKTELPKAIVCRKTDTIKLLKLVQNGEILLNSQDFQPPFISVRKNIY